MLIYEDITEKIIKSSYEVHKILGIGFLEKVYENALIYELQLRGIECESQKSIDIYYKDIIVGKYIADILVDKKIIIEIKANSGITDEHFAQVLNYLKGTNNRLGILVNFGLPKIQMKRVVN